MLGRFIDALKPRLRTSRHCARSYSIALPCTNMVEESNGADTRTQLLRAVDTLNIWKRDGRRAPHKPLLLLLVLGRLRAGEDPRMAFSLIEEPLRDLLTAFGPPRKPHPEYPFWHLATDGIWEVQGPAVEARRPADTPSITAARAMSGGLPVDLWNTLQENPQLVDGVARRLLDGHFPQSLHEDILERVGLEITAIAPRRDQRRDPNFRVLVLRAYGYRCSMCGYDGRVDTVPIGLEAAHICWWAAGGPDDVANALALCSLHHKAFDMGAIGFTDDHRITVSQAFNGSRRAHEVIGDLNGASLQPPQAGMPRPAEMHRRWHEVEVFKGPSRGVHAVAAEPPTSYRS